MNEKVLNALNRQINAELYSAYLYLSMAAYFGFEGLKGFANWMRVQAQEELMHAMKIFDYVNERGGRVKLEAIEAPPSEWRNPLEVFESVLSHEKKVTSMINGLVELSMEEKDHATYNFLQWFVAEQVEEEASADEIRRQLELIGDDRRALLMIDRELAQRKFTAQTSQTEEVA
ncbi:MAG: ferritin [Archaeoglobi archaeon]|nr:ferritin [Candidatus Mnemosynella sp.]